jgi:hypothetical protein
MVALRSDSSGENLFFVRIALKATLPTSNARPETNVKIAKNTGPLRLSKKNLS